MVQTWFFREAYQSEVIQEVKSAWSTSPKARDYYGRECDHGNDDLVVGFKLNSDIWKMDKQLLRMIKLFEYLGQPPT